MAKALFDQLRADESLKEVYFDDKGGWLLVPSDLHPHKKTRNEVLAGEEEWEKEYEAKQVPIQSDEEGEFVDVTERLTELEAKEEELNLEIERISGENEGLATENETLTNQVSGLLKENEAYTTQVFVLSKQVEDLQKENAKLKKKADKVEPTAAA